MSAILELLDIVEVDALEELKGLLVLSFLDLENGLLPLLIG